MRNIVKYLLILIITLLVAIVAGGDFVLFLLGFELVLPVFLYIYVRYLVKNIHFSTEIPATVSKGEEVFLEIHLKNEAKLPISCVTVEFTCRDVFDESTLMEVVSGAIDAKGESTIRIGIKAEYAGRLAFQIEKMKGYDCFHFLSYKVPMKKEWKQMLVKPDIYQVAVEGTSDALSLDQRGESHSTDKSGDDVSEVFGIREYRAGDTLHKVHWKLSAKTDELLVKEFSNPMKTALFVFVDLYTDREEKWTHERFDGMATILASLSHSLLLQKEEHEIFWYHAGENALHSMKIAGEGDIYEVVGELSAAKAYDYPYDFQAVLQEQGMTGNRAKAFVIDMDWNLYSGDQCIASMTEENIHKELLSLRIVQ